MSYGQPIAPARPPPGWVPPFAGAPPPVPPGVNPQMWGAGAWQFNSAYQYQPPPPNSASWAAGFGWYGGMQPGGQPAASYNPHKRVPRAPSAEYMANELSDNPLGLSNMIPREELFGEDGAPQTPWIWNPPGLISTDADEGVITAAFIDERGNRIAQEVRGPTPSRQSSVDRIDGSSSIYSQTAHREPTPFRQSSIDRQNGSSIYAQIPHQEPTPSRKSSQDRTNDLSPNQHPPIRRDSAPSRQNSQDRLNDASSVHSSSSRSALPTLDRPLGRPRDPSSIYQQRFNSPGVPDSSPRESPSRSGHAPDKYSQVPQRREKPDDESFTSKIELQPTFSTNIVRIPDHYHSPSRRNSYDDEGSRTSSSSYPSSHSSSHPSSHSSHSSHGPSSSNFPVALLTSRMEHLNTNNSSSNAVTRHSSLPASIYASSSVSNGLETDEQLSPLMYGVTPKPTSRPALRGFSVPDIRGTPLNTIPEASSSSSSSISYRPRSRHASPASPSSHEGRPTPSSGSSTSPNRLPRPPVDVHNPITSAPPPRVPTPPAGTFSNRVRVGFWNRRGDHLTRTMHIVYAPPEKAYPKDLEGYPPETRGYRDHLGLEIPFVPDRPELPESLPRHGRPPVHPYDSFVVYEYRK